MLGIFIILAVGLLLRGRHHRRARSKQYPAKQHPAKQHPAE
jgi:hypothetical protein